MDFARSSMIKEKLLVVLCVFIQTLEPNFRILISVLFVPSTKHEFFAPKTPQQNGVVEKKNRVVQEMAQVMLHSKNISQRLYAEVVNTAVHIINRVYLRPGTKMTPYEILIIVGLMLCMRNQNNLRETVCGTQFLDLVTLMLSAPSGSIRITRFNWQLRCIHKLKESILKKCLPLLLDWNPSV